MIRGIRTKIALAFVVVAMTSIAALAQNQQTLRTIDGRSLDLKDMRGKIVVLSFGGTWIPMASKELPALQKLADRYTARGVQFYWVSVNSSKPGARNSATDADLQAFAQKNNLKIPVLRDPDQEAYRGFGLDALPTVIILDRDGRVARKHVGFGPDQGESYSEVIRELEQLLK